MPYCIDNGGPLEQLSISSDMDSSTPAIFYAQFCGLVVKHGVPLEVVLPLFTLNSAKALKLEGKGCLSAGKDADVLVVTEGDMEIRHVVANGKVLFSEGLALVREKWLKKSKRSVAFIGDEHPTMR